MSDEAGCRHGRYAYSPLPRRTTYDWPGARRSRDQVTKSDKAAKARQVTMSY